MKNTLLLFFLSLIFHTNGQSPEVMLSRNYDLGDFNETKPDIIGYSSNSFFCCNRVKNQIHFLEFEKQNLAFKKETIFDFPGTDKSEKALLRTIQCTENGFIYFITSEENKGTDSFYVYGFSVDWMCQRSEVRLLEKMAMKDYQKPWNFGYILSPNKKYFAIYHDLTKIENTSCVSEIKVFDFSNSNLVKEDTLFYPTEYLKYKLQTILINDDVAIFVCLHLKGLYVNQERFKLLAYRDNEKAFENIKAFGEIFPFDVSFVMDNTNVIFASGISLDKEDIRIIRGYFCVRIDSRTRKLISGDVKAIDSEFQLAFYSEEGAGDYRVICDLPVRAITQLADSTTFITSEIYYSGFTSQNGGKNVFYFGDIVTAVIAANGDIKSIIIIPKFQIGYDTHRSLGCIITETPIGVGYIYLDNDKNYDGNKRIKKKIMRRVSITSTISALVDSGGVVSYRVLDTMDENVPGRPEIQGESSISDDNKTQVLYSVRGSTFMFVKLEY